MAEVVNFYSVTLDEAERLLSTIGYTPACSPDDACASVPEDMRQFVADSIRAVAAAERTNPAWRRAGQ
jgi:hypothetical protein